MIKLDKGNAPAILTTEEEQRLAAVYAENNNSDVWRKHGIPKALLESSFNKCAYCEIKLDNIRTYYEIDHFKPKSLYCDSVAEWDNLIPSCRGCNNTKRSHDVIAEPIINPYKDNPKDHLYLKNYRYYGRTPLGETTEEVLELNETSLARFEIGHELLTKLKKCSEDIEFLKQDNSSKYQRRVLRTIKILLNFCQKEMRYSALNATLLHSEEYYKKIVLEMQTIGIWDDELQRLHDQSFALALIE